MNNSSVLLAVLLICVLAFVFLREPQTSAPDATLTGPGALAADSVAARQQLAAARQTAEAIQRRQAAATANSIATDRAIAAAATATEAAFNLALRRAQATATAQAQHATATAEALTFAAALDAQRGQATAQAIAAQATAERIRTDATTSAQLAAIAVERERAWTGTLNALCGLGALSVFAAFTAALYWFSLAAKARYTTHSLVPVPGGTVLILGTPQTGFNARSLPAPMPSRPRPAKPAPAEIIPAQVLSADTPAQTPRTASPGGTGSSLPLDPDRALVIRLLRQSIRFYGDDSDRIAPATAPGWTSEQWQRAKGLLGEFVRVRKGRDGGTYLAFEDYPTLSAMLAGVLSGSVALGREPSPTASAPLDRTPSTPAHA